VKGRGGGRGDEGVKREARGAAFAFSLSTLLYRLAPPPAISSFLEERRTCSQVFFP
jgi:hypothetical protein